MDIGSVNHEVAFCKVYDMATKEKVERILLKNRISYYRGVGRQRSGGTVHVPEAEG